MKTNMKNNFNHRQYEPSAKDLKEAYLSSVLDIQEDESLEDLLPELEGIDGFSLRYERGNYES